MRFPVSYYIELKRRQARVNILGSSSTIRQYRRSLLFTRASLAFLNMVSNPRIELGFLCIYSLCNSILLLPCAMVYYAVCVYVCVFFPFILDIKFLGRTSRGHTGGRSHRRKVTGFLIHLLSAVRALIFLARRIQPFISLVDCGVEFYVLTI